LPIPQASSQNFAAYRGKIVQIPRLTLAFPFVRKLSFIHGAQLC